MSNTDNTLEAMPHNGKLLTNYLLNNQIVRAKLARKLNISNTSVYQYAESSSLQMHILWKASIALNHNFIAEVGEKLPVDYITTREKELQEQVETLQKELERLNIELEVYKNIVGK